MGSYSPEVSRGATRGTGLGGVLGRPGLAVSIYEHLGAPRGAVQLVCVGQAWRGGLWLFQQLIRCVGASWDIFYINVVEPVLIS